METRTRSVAQEILDAPSSGQALERAAQFLCVVASAGVELTMEAGGRIAVMRAGEVTAPVTVVRSTAGSVKMLAAFSAEVTDVDHFVDLITVSLHARFANQSASVDTLTGVANRSGFEQRMQHVITGALAIVDVDAFKAYNDRYGHMAGDAVLRRIAHAASASLQHAGDFFARYGGEEFVALLDCNDEAEAAAACERIREAIRGLAIPHADGKGGRVTVSIGFSLGRDEDEAARAVLQRADANLYRAKTSGRDRVCGDSYSGSAGGPGSRAKAYTELLGREEELGRVLNALRSAPLVTLTGASATGKTRLAFNAACLSAHRFHTIELVDAWSAVDASDLLRRLQNALSAGKGTLVVLDACEHLVDGCAGAIAQLNARGVRVIATSRVPLGLREEYVVRLSGIDPVSAARLFDAGMRWSGAMSAGAADESAAIQRRLAGIPGAILSAAAALCSQSPKDLLDTLSREGAFSVERSNLHSIVSDAVAACTAYSGAFAAAAAFVTPFRTEDALAISPNDRADVQTMENQLHVLQRLGVLACHDGRWLLPEIVRDAASKRVQLTGVRRRTQSRHLQWCLRAFEACDERLGRVENRPFVEAIGPLLPEIDAALQRGLAEEHLTAAGMQLCYEACRFWYATSRFAEAYRWCEGYLDTGRGDSTARMRLLAALARIAHAQNRLEQMEAYALQALPQSESDPPRRAVILNYLGIAAKARLEADQAMSFFRRSYECARESGERRLEAIALASMGSVSMDLQIDFAPAQAAFASAVPIMREFNDALNTITCEAKQIKALAELGEMERAEEIAARILPEARALDNPGVLLLVFGAYVSVLQTRGDVAVARFAATEALQLAPRLDSANYHAVYDLCGRVAQMRGDEASALRLFLAAERRQMREGGLVLPVDRYYRERAFEAMKAGLSEQQEALTHVRTLNDADVLELCARAVL